MIRNQQRCLTRIFSRSTKYIYPSSTTTQQRDNCLISKILLISVNRCTNPYPIYPLGVSYVAGALRKEGFTVSLLDMLYESDNLKETIATFAPDLIGLSLRNIDDIRIDAPRFFVPELYTLIARIRKHTQAPLVLGGSAFSLFPATLLADSGADYGIAGEGETTLVKLIKLLSSKPKPSVAELQVIPGLYSTIGGDIAGSQQEPLSPDAIGIPLRTDEHLAYYQQKCSIINLQTQRGCPFTCCYCTYPIIEGATIRYRPATAVVDEIATLHDRGATYLFIVDSVFNATNSHVIGICDEIVKRNIRMAWSCFLRPKNITPELIAAMKAAGVRHIEFGSDSFCDSVLAAYGKQFTFDDILASSEAVRAAKIRYAHFLICGGPGENEATLEESFANSQKLKKTVIFPFIGMRLYPGTPLFAHALAEGSIQATDSLLAPRFYLTPNLTKEIIREKLDRFHKQAPNWIVDDLSEEQVFVMNGLRSRGITGPLWEFLIR